MRMRYPLVSVIVVNYNGIRFLKGCFNSLLAMSYPKSKLEIIMVDNKSQDGSVEYIRNRYPKIKIIENGINNYALANNLGIRRAKGKYVALLNNDTKVVKNWLGELMKAIVIDKTIAGVGSKILLLDGRIDSTGHLELPDFYWVDRGALKKGKNLYNHQEDASSLSGCSVLYRKAAIEDVDYFDEDFNMYMEDVDMAFRLKNKKWKLIYVPKSIVYHVHKGTAEEGFSLFLTERNRLLFLAKHYPEKLSDCLMGRGYFTAKRDDRAQIELYRILANVVLKLIKHHKITLVKEVLNDLFEEVRKIANYDNIILIDKVESFAKSLESHQEILKEKDKSINTLNIELFKYGQEIKTREEILAVKDSKINDLSLGIKDFEQTIKSKTQELDALRLQLEQDRQALSKKEQVIADVNAQIAKYGQEIKNNTEQLNVLHLQLEQSSQVLSEREQLIIDLKTSIAKHEQDIKDKREQLNIYHRQLVEGTQSLLEKERVIAGLSLEITKREQLINEKTEQNRDLDIRIQQSQHALAEKEQALSHLNFKVIEVEGKIKDKEEEISGLYAEIEQRNQLLDSKDCEMAGLNNQITKLDKELNDVYNSTIFRFVVRPVWTVLWDIKQRLRRFRVYFSGQKEVASVKTYVGPPFMAPAELGAEGKKSDLQNIGICTIISKNYLAYARVLTDSFRQYNQGGVFVLLTDRVDGFFDPAKEKFTLIELEAIKDRIPDFDRFCFQYNITELNTAVKPYFMKYLFEEYQLNKLIFFDPDILITYNLEEIFSLLDKFSIVLIPHITQPYSDNRKPYELDIIKAGVYNLGFIALSNSGSTKRLLEWWKKRLNRYCIIDVQKGLFVDQKWIDLVPGFFEDAYILKDESYNISYWNLHYRKVYLQGSAIFVNGAPARFLHFSGLNLDNIALISKHQDRFKIRDLKHMRPIFELFKDKLIANGYKSCKDWPCYFDYFDDGAVIPDIIRRFYWELEEEIKNKLGNPFNTLDKGSYINWLNGNIDNSKPKITRFMYKIYSIRMDIQRIYGDIFGFDREGFFQWFLANAQIEYNFENSFLNKMFPFNLKGKQRAVVSLKTRLFYKVRGMLKICLKKIFKSKPSVIKSLKALEYTWHGKIINIRASVVKKKPQKVGGNHKNGINILGYLTAELGVGEAARSSVKCIRHTGLSFSLVNIESHSISRKCDSTFLSSGFSKDNPYDINLIHVNADLFPKVYVESGTAFFKDKYNIGYWNWELPDFPDEWLNSFNYCDEIWVPTAYTLASVAKKSPIPVLKIPISVAVDNVKDVKRPFFGLREGDFIFLFVFDFFSYFTRKNPLAIIKAFKQSFSVSEKAMLVIKCCNSNFDPRSIAITKQAAQGHNIEIIDRYLYRDEVNALISLCDCYVSLHRSEGFGLTLAEAMFLGKPVIATGFSGNADFMNINNSYPVRYQLVPLENNVGPYKKGWLWAEPDTKHAAELMRYVYENRCKAIETGQIASQEIRKNLSSEKIGLEIKNRINQIYESSLI